MPEVWQPLQHLELSDREAAEHAVNRFETGRWFPQLGLARGEILQSFLQTQSRTWPGLYETILRLYAKQSSDALTFGDKTPGHYHHIGTLLRWFPNCRILFMIRDPRAVVASNLKAPFAPPYAWFTARRWNDSMKKYSRHRHDERVKLVSYEEFVSDPSSTLTALAPWLIAEPHYNNQPAEIPRTIDDEGGWRASHLRSAGKPVNTMSLSRWREDLTPYEIWQIEQSARSAMVEHGYIPTNRSGGDLALRLKFAVRFPFERLQLTVRRAAQEQSAGLVAQTLIGLGMTLDRLRYIRRQTSMPRQKRDTETTTAIVHLGPEHQQWSSYSRTTPACESLGLFVSSLVALGWRVQLRVNSHSQFCAALATLEGFGRERDIAIFIRKTDSSLASRLEIYEGDDKSPALRKDPLQIGSNTAREDAEVLHKCWSKR